MAIYDDPNRGTLPVSRGNLPSDVVVNEDGSSSWRGRRLDPPGTYAPVGRNAAMPIARPRFAGETASVGTPQTPSVAATPVPSPRPTMGSSASIPVPRSAPTDSAPIVSATRPRDDINGVAFDSAAARTRLPEPFQFFYPSFPSAIQTPEGKVLAVEGTGLTPGAWTPSAASPAGSPGQAPAPEYARARDRVPAPEVRDTGPLVASANSAVDAATLGFGDRVIAGALAPVEAGIQAYNGQGFSLGRGYDSAQAKMAAVDAQQRQDHPVASAIGDVAGAFGAVGVRPGARTPVSASSARPTPQGGVPSAAAAARAPTAAAEGAISSPAAGRSVARRVYEGEILRGEPAATRSAGALERPTIEGTVNPPVAIGPRNVVRVTDGNRTMYVSRADAQNPGVQTLPAYSANGRPVVSGSTVSRETVSAAAPASAAKSVPRSSLVSVKTLDGRTAWTSKSDLANPRARTVELYDRNGRPLNETLRRSLIDRRK